jgi:hypothetical protein
MQAFVKRLLILAALAGLSACAPARADGQIYLCVDADGRKELNDVGRKGKCKLLDLPGTISAPSPRKPAPAAPRQDNPAPVASPSPSDFPRVDNAQQKARDLDRRLILQEELQSEEAKLTFLKKEFNGEPERNGSERNNPKYLERVAQMKDSISRAEKNVEALKREIANIR